jgi:hypothetical protein
MQFQQEAQAGNKGNAPHSASPSGAVQLRASRQKQLQQQQQQEQALVQPPNPRRRQCSGSNHRPSSSAGHSQMKMM